MKKYKTPNGQIVDESVLKQKYGDRFESLISDGTFSLYEEQATEPTKRGSADLYLTPNGKEASKQELESKYGDRFSELVNDGTFKKKSGGEPSPENTSPTPSPFGVQSESEEGNVFSKPFLAANQPMSPNLDKNVFDPKINQVVVPQPLEIGGGSKPLVINSKTIPVSPYDSNSSYLSGLQQRILSGKTTKQDAAVIEKNQRGNYYNEDDEAVVNEIASSYNPDAKNKVFSNEFATLDEKIAALNRLKSVATNNLNSELPAYGGAGVSARRSYKGETDDAANVELLTKIQDKLLKEKQKEDLNAVKVYSEANVSTDKGHNDVDKLDLFFRKYLVSVVGGILNNETLAEEEVRKQPIGFSVGINNMKYSDPEKFKRYTRYLAEGKVISATDVANITNDGLQTIADAATYDYANNKINTEQYKAKLAEVGKGVNENVLNNKEVLYGVFSDLIAQKGDEIRSVTKPMGISGNSVADTYELAVGNYMHTDEEIAMYGKMVANEKGWDYDDARIQETIKRLQGREGWMLFQNAIAKSGYARDVVKGAKGVVKGFANTIDNIGMDADKRFAEGISEANRNVYDERLERIKNDPVLNTMSSIFEGVGQFAAQGLLMSGGAGLFARAGTAALGGRVGVAALEGTEAAGLSLTASELGATNFVGKLMLKNKDFLSVMTTTFAQTFDNNLKTAYGYTSDDNIATAVAFGMSNLESLTENLLSPLDIIKKLRTNLFNKKEVASGLADILSNDALAGASKLAKLKTFLKPIIKGAWESTGVIATEIGEENVTQTADFLANGLLNPNSKSYADRNFLKEVANTSLETGLSMVLPAILGGVGAYKANTFSKGSLIVAAENRQNLIESLQAKKQNGDITETQYNEKVAIINSAEVANNLVPKRDDNKPMSFDEKTNFVYSKVSQAALQKQLDEYKGDKNDPEYKQIQEKIQKQQKFREDILKLKPTYYINGEQVGKSDIDAVIKDGTYNDLDLVINNDQVTQDKLRKVGGVDLVKEDKTELVKESKRGIDPAIADVLDIVDEGEDVVQDVAATTVGAATTVAAQAAPVVADKPSLVNASTLQVGDKIMVGDKEHTVKEINQNISVGNNKIIDNITTEEGATINNIGKDKANWFVEKINKPIAAAQAEEVKQKADVKNASDGVLVTDLINKKVNFNGTVGVVKQDEGGKLTLENEGKVIELKDNDIANEILNKVEVKGNSVRIDNDSYEFVSTNKDKDGNVVSVTLKDKNGKEITKRDSELALDIAIAKNNDDFNSKQNISEQEYQETVKPKIDVEFQKEFGGAATQVIESMPDEVADTFVAMESGIVALSPNELQGMVLRASEWVEEAKKKINNSKAPQSEKLEAIRMVNKFNNDLNKYYEKIEKQRKSQDASNAKTKQTESVGATKQKAEQVAEEKPKEEKKSESKETAKVLTEKETKKPSEKEEIELEPQVKGGLKRVMRYEDGAWVQVVGGQVTRVGDFIQRKAQEAFEKNRAIQQQSDVIDAKNAESVKVEDEASLKGKLTADAKKVALALKKLMPNLKIFIHDTDKDMKNATGITSRGGFISMGNGKGEMHINVEAIARAINSNSKAYKSNTAFHEGVHPILNIIAEANPDAISSLHKQLEALSESYREITPILAYGINEGKRMKDEAAGDMEAVVEFISQVANGDIQLKDAKQSVIDKAIKIIKDFVRMITGKPVEIDNVNDLVSLAKQLSEAFQSGKSVSIEKSIEDNATRGLQLQEEVNKEIFQNPVYFENAKDFANKSEYNNKRDFKEGLQNLLNGFVKSLKGVYGKNFDPKKYDEKTKLYLENSLIAEALNAIKQHPEAIGWYDEKTQSALDVVSTIHPEIATDMEARGAFILPLAIMSNGNKVDFNFELAEAQYDYFKKNGRFNSKGKFGLQQAGIIKSLKFVNSLLDQGLSIKDINTFFTSKYSAGELKVNVNGKIKSLASGELVDEPVYGAVVLGSKIGNGFYMNLWGQFDQLTMDRWFMRTWGRLTGTLIEDRPDKIKKAKSRVASSILSIKSDKEASSIVKSIIGATSKLSTIDFAEAIQKASMDVGDREKLAENEVTNELRLSSNSLMKALSGEKEAPQNGKERRFIRTVFNSVINRLESEHGINISMADLQAALWYPEKTLYESFKKGESFESALEGYTADEAPDYLNAAIKLATKKGVTNETIRSAISAGRRISAGENKNTGYTTGSQGLVGSNKEILGKIKQAAGHKEKIKKEKPYIQQQGALPDEKTTSIYVAPFFDATVADIKEAKEVEKSPAYKKHIETINNIAKAIGIGIESTSANVGRYTNDDGNKVREVSTLVVLKTTDMDKATLFGALSGALAPEVQESTIVAKVIPEDKIGTSEHDANKIVITVSDAEKARELADEVGLDNTVNENTITFLEFNDKKHTWFDKKGFDEKSIIFADKLDQNGIKHTTEAIAIESRLITADGADGTYSRKSILKEAKRKVESREQRASKRDAISVAEKRNKEFIRQKKLAPERKEYEALRAKEISSALSGERLTDEEVKRITDLYEKLLPHTEKTFTNAEGDYTASKAEIDNVAKELVGDKGFVSPFGIKRAARAAVKTLRWYGGKAQWLGDGARTNIIVFNKVDIEPIFKKIQEHFNGGIVRLEPNDTDLGYPKRLLEVRTSNGKISEFQVMTPDGYLAKDGVKDFAEDKRSFAKEQLGKIQEKLGWAIPDGVGHYFYEINRDENIPKKLREQAKQVSLRYYDAMLNPSKSNLTEQEFIKEVSAFKDAVDSADKASWDKGNMGKSPDSLNKFLEERTNSNVSKKEVSLQTKAKGNEQSGAEGLPQSTGDRAGSNQARVIAPLEGAPIIQGATGADANLVSVAEKYAKENGIKLSRQASYAEVNPEFAKRVADAYEQMKHEPDNPIVREAYDNLIKQTKAQYDALVKDGYQFSFFDEKTDPYAGNPYNAMRDLRNNKKMAVYGTYDGYGENGISQDELANNPMLADTGLKWEDQNGVKRMVTANDLFRAVHDAFGHGLEGSGFRARGEENAWQAHSRLFTGSALAAMTTETRGQNSWLNFGKYGEQNRTAKVEDTVFAEQKVGLMPSWTWTENKVGDMPNTKEGSVGVGGDVVVVAKNNDIIKQNKIEGGLLNEQQSIELQKEIESKYNTDVQKFGQENEDIRQSMYNYDNPLAEKNVNGVNLRIADGLIEGDKYSGNRRKTYLLYADGKIAGKFYSVSDAKKVVKFIEDNLVKGVGEGKAVEQSLKEAKAGSVGVGGDVKLKSGTSDIGNGLTVVKEIGNDEKFPKVKIVLKDSNGKSVSQFDGFITSDNTIHPSSILTFEGNRRKGYATKIYDYLKEQGYDVTESKSITDEGKLFRKGREGKAVEQSIQNKSVPQSLPTLKSKSQKVDVSNEEWNRWQKENTTTTGIATHELKDGTEVEIDFVNSRIRIGRQLRGLDYVYNNENYSAKTFDDQKDAYKNFINRAKELVYGDKSFSISNDKRSLVEQSTKEQTQEGVIEKATSLPPIEITKESVILAKKIEEIMQIKGEDSRNKTLYALHSSKKAAYTKEQVERAVDAYKNFEKYKKDLEDDGLLVTECPI